MRTNPHLGWYELSLHILISLHWP